MVEIRYGAKDIDDFISKLEKYTLDPAFEKYGNFIRKNQKSESYIKAKIEISCR